mmetsp:Transcript_32110/g.70279  ORF Transcript_32110/g.70279 Transcript_32110/m.70279 type:complete len:273 (-) Transcript_32110:142-960(-)
MLTEDDFGRPQKHSAKGDGLCNPCASVGATLLDLPAASPRPRAQDLPRSSLDISSLRPLEAVEFRREKKAILDETGRALDPMRPSSGRQKPRGLRHIDFRPAPAKGPFSGSKRVFPRTGPTGWENLAQYELPPAPGCRPMHPVSATGVVALERKRTYPAEPSWASGMMPPCSVPPLSSEWGGWAKDGSPGRHPQQRPWDSLVQRGEDPMDASQAHWRLCDARRMIFPEGKYKPTAQLTRWHLDRVKDVEPCKQRKLHFNEPSELGRSTGCGW